MKILKDWIYAANVCKKYNLTWNPYVKLGYGSYDWNTREDVIEKYRLYLWEQIKKGNITKEDLHELNGSVLGCFCKPQACHGDVLLKALEWSLK